MMMFCIWVSTAVEKWWQHEAGSCKGADERGAGSRELSGWLSGQCRSNRDCLGGRKVRVHVPWACVCLKSRTVMP